MLSVYYPLLHFLYAFSLCFFATLLLHFWCYTFFASLHYTLVCFFATPFATLCYNFVQQFFTMLCYTFGSLFYYTFYYTFGTISNCYTLHCQWYSSTSTLLVLHFCATILYICTPQIFVSILLYHSTHFFTLTGLAIVYLKMVQFVQSVQVCGLYAKTTVLWMYCASMSSHIHTAMRHGFQGSLGFVLVPSSSPRKFCTSTASKSFSW